MLPNPGVRRNSSHADSFKKIIKIKIGNPSLSSTKCTIKKAQKSCKEKNESLIVLVYRRYNNKLTLNE